MLLPQVGTAQIRTEQSLTVTLFERYLESLRQQAGIPGLSAVIVQDGDIAWEHGFGFRDVENSFAAAPDTPYPIADLTQTFASVLLMQCVERGLMDLTDPLARWSAGTSGSVQQALSHTSANTFRYDPTAFAKLTPAVDACAGQSARVRVARDVFSRFGMMDSVPGRDLVDTSSDARPAFDTTELDRYTAALNRMALPYKVDKRGRATRSDLPPKRIDASTGLVSSARDLFRFDAALDALALVHDDALLRTMWTNVTTGGVARPMGLGWFVQTYNGERVVWHFGQVTDAYSSMIIKVPSKRLTLIMLANSDGLTSPFDLGQGDLTTSVFAVTFLRLFL